MEAIFYDRKNKCEVKASQLMPINFILTVATTQDNHERFYNKTLEGSYDIVLGEIGYKSENASNSQNWDRPLMYTDLIFLRFE